MKRAKSKTSLNAKYKPSAKGKTGGIKVGDRFLDKKNSKICVVTHILPEENMPYVCDWVNLGWPSTSVLSHTYLTRQCWRYP